MQTAISPVSIIPAISSRRGSGSAGSGKRAHAELSNSSIESAVEPEAFDPVSSVRVLIDSTVAHTSSQPTSCRLDGLGGSPKPLDSESCTLFNETPEIGVAPLERRDFF